MSIVSLNSIRTKSGSNQDDFYVSMIIDSKSGFLVPKLIRSTEDVDSFYGDFSYSEMVKGFIREGIPVLLLPYITPTSKYNIPTLRFNKGSLPISNPKIDKTYKFMSLGVIYEYEFGPEVLTEDNKFIFHNPLPFNSVMTIESGGVEIFPPIMYEGDIITVLFPSRIRGTITIESLPQLESNPEYIKNYSIPQGRIFFPIEKDSSPEIVVVNSLGHSVKYTYELIESQSVTDCSLTIVNYNPYETYEATVRVIPKHLTSVREITEAQTVIDHELDHYPKVKLTKNKLLSSGKVEYINKDSMIITLESPEGTILKYNVITNQSSFDWKRIYSKEYSFNHILDFSKVADDDLLGINGFKYLIIRLNEDDHLISTKGVLPPWLYTTYYNFRKIISDDSRESALSDIKDYIKSIVGPTNCIDIVDILNDFIDKLSNYSTDHFSNFREWKLFVYGLMYSEDFWLLDNYSIYLILSKIFEILDYNDDKNDPDKFSRFVINDSVNDIKLELENLNISRDKLLINHSLPTSNLNFYDFDGLKIYQDFNLSQDRLCELTENDKICEFQSKIKGPKGSDIKISLSKIPNFDYLYDLTISLGSKIEYFMIYVGEREIDYPSDSISLSDLSYNSELISSKVYDYTLTTGRVIDQRDFNVHKLEDEVYDPYRTKSANQLSLDDFVGDWNLSRVTEEFLNYNSVINSYLRLASSDYYPDFLLEFNTNWDEYSEYHLELLLQVSKVLSTQCLIKLNYKHLTYNYKKLFTDNRLLYFYDDLEIKGSNYCSFYPYVLNFIKSDYLKIISDSIIYDKLLIKEGNGIILNGVPGRITKYESGVIRVEDDYGKVVKGRLEGDTIVSDEIYNIESIEDYLKLNSINYLYYNNLYYYYKGILEDRIQENYFIVKFITSKISRVILENERKLKGVEISKFEIKMNSIIDRIRSILPIIKDLSYYYQITENKIELNIIVIIKSMINKELKLNYILNI